MAVKCMVVLLFAVALQSVVCPPVTKAKPGEKPEDNEINTGTGEQWDIGIEYNRYLKEVVQALENDPQFREKLEKAEAADIRTGKIANELEYVNHKVRTNLDELKRQELERLRHLAIQEYEVNKGIDKKRLKIPHHIDHKNPHTFEIEDLRKLIIQTTRELEEADRKRKDEFKEYEMQKEFERHEKMKLVDEEHQKQIEKEYEEQEKKHKEHPQLHHPGSKDQFEEVWEEQDHMNPEDFNPKTFFYLHDLDGNGFWDADEVKSLFQKELDKMYDPNAPEDDMRERREEMERMREHVFNETDTNRDQLISFQEFLEQTKKADFEEDPGWEGLDQKQAYTQDEYREFEHRRQQEIDRMIQQGLLPPQPILHGMPPPGYIGGPGGQQPMYHHPQGQQFPPQGGYQQHPNAVPQGAFQGQQHPQFTGQDNQFHPGMQAQHPNQVPQDSRTGQLTYQQQQLQKQQQYQQQQQHYQQQLQQHQQQQQYQQHQQAAGQQHPPVQQQMHQPVGQQQQQQRPQPPAGQQPNQPVAPQQQAAVNHAPPPVAADSQQQHLNNNNNQQQQQQQPPVEHTDNKLKEESAEAHPAPADSHVQNDKHQIPEVKQLVH